MPKTKSKAPKEKTMAQQKKLTAESVKAQLPPELADVFDKLRQAGLGIWTILSLYFQYGAEALIQFVQELIDKLKPAQEVMQKAKAQAKQKAQSGEGCDEELAGALCETQCNLVHALISNHLACEAAGCCVDPDEPDEPESQGQKDQSKPGKQAKK